MEEQGKYFVNVENYPVSDLPSRFNLGKQAVYNRLEALSIKPIKVGKRSYISAEQLEVLDRLHLHIDQCGSMADFESSHLLQIIPLDAIDKSTGLVENVHTQAELLVNLIAGAVSGAIASTVQQRNPLWYMSELEKAEAQSWLLTTSEVHQLIGVKPTTPKKVSIYQRGCFIFTKAGKIGTQTAWKVKKIIPDR